MLYADWTVIWPDKSEQQVPGPLSTCQYRGLVVANVKNILRQELGE